MLERSQDLKELAAALAKAQGAFKPAAMTGKNPHFKSRFATLADIWDAVKGPLAANGLSVVQGAAEQDEAGFNVRTMVLHASGQFISAEVRMPLGGNATAQSVGSALSYGRRYGLAALLGIVADEDDDGDAATESVKQSPPRASSGGGNRRMPFGKTKGKLLSELTDAELESAVQWCSENDDKRTKFADLIADMLTEIDRRGGMDGHE